MEEDMFNGIDFSNGSEFLINKETGEKNKLFKNINDFKLETGVEISINGNEMTDKQRYIFNEIHNMGELNFELKSNNEIEFKKPKFSECIVNIEINELYSDKLKVGRIIELVCKDEFKIKFVIVNICDNKVSMHDNKVDIDTKPLAYKINDNSKWVSLYDVDNNEDIRREFIELSTKHGIIFV